MNSIFEQLNTILMSINESGESAKAKVEKIVKSIPVNPEMETSEQGIKTAWEKFAKYFYNLKQGGGDGPISLTDKIDLPDDFLDPVLKGKRPEKNQDKEFKKNKVLWDDNDELEKLKKEIEGDAEGSSEDDFDDFDYQDNPFGDDSSDESSDSSSDSDDSEKSEKEKLKDTIDKAIDKLKDEKKSGKQSGSENGSKGSEKVGDKPMSTKDKKLSDLQDALERGDEGSFGGAMDDLKEGEDGTGKLAGEYRGEVSDDELKNEMGKAGISSEDIDEMTDMKNNDTSKEISEEEFEKLKKKVIDGLEDKCKKRGGSALAKSVVKKALKAKIEDEEWREILKHFLKSKSIMKGTTSKAKNKTIYGHKNHLWRDAVLPTRSYGKGEIQKIYCFIDFSGSVDQNLVFTFLGRVIDLCQELSYTDVIVYGFGDQIVLPRKINGKMLKSDGREVVLSQTWDYIRSQYPGGGSENFEDVAHTINEIRRKEADSVFLIFGDALWSNYGNSHPPIYLKNVCGEKVFKDICVLTYYTYPNSTYAGEIAYLKELVGLKSVITTKATNIYV